jgi:hypothetical protein
MKRAGLEPAHATAGEFGAWRTSQAEAVAREHRGLSLLD